MKSLYDLEPEEDPKKQQKKAAPEAAAPAKPKKDLNELKQKVKELAEKDEKQSAAARTDAAPQPAGATPAGPGKGIGKALTMVNMILLLLVLVLQVMIIRWQTGVNDALATLEQEVNNEKKLRADLAGELLKKIEAVQDGAVQAAKPAGSPVFVTTRKVNVRSSASARGRLISKLKKGGVVKGLSAKEGWRRISFGTKKGWVSDEYLTSVGAVTITAKKMNIRSKPSARAKKVTVLKKGKKVPVLDYANKWYKIDLGDGKTGWVMRKYVRISG